MDKDASPIADLTYVRLAVLESIVATIAAADPRLTAEVRAYLDHLRVKLALTPFSAEDLRMYSLFEELTAGENESEMFDAGG